MATKGLKKMLAQGIANENELLSKASKAVVSIEEETVPDLEPVKVETAAPIINIAPSVKKKNLGGRPTNRERGIQSRKQYTLTLKEDTYNMIMEEARKEELSFAKFMERAALEYINNKK